jgi:penicillin amidase
MLVRGLRRAAAALLALMLLAGLALALYLWRATPAHDGTFEVAPGAVSAPVSIERDTHGIPTIRAASVEDAAFALGLVHAQDRLWQLETHRRIGSGRLAEVLGTGALDNDRFLRALGVRRAAQAQWARLGDESKRVLLAYAAGVNAWQRQHLKVRPPEMLILGAPVEDWTPVDSLAWAIMMAWDLGANWSTELLRARLALTLPVSRIDELLPPYPGEAPRVTADYAALMRSLRLGGALASSGSTAEAIDTLQAMAPPSGVEGSGSNNWVVDGAHSTTGRPLLANDPHLKITAPALWYLARIEVAGEGGFKAAGATLPGLPGVVLGQNEHIAWGFTNTNPDVQDLYLEQFKPGDATQVRTPDGWQPLQRIDEEIRVKGAPSVTLPVRVSRHGPLISDAGGAAGEVAGAAHGIAMRWTALDADIDPIAANLALSRARSSAEFVDAATRWWAAPMQNMVVADRDGRIAFVAAGRVPRRKADNDLMGLVPAPGWDARYDWDGQVPAGETPRESGGARGFIASANQRIHAEGYPHFITSEWAPPYRHQRIEQLLRARMRHSIDDMAAMQADVQSPATERLLPWLRRALPAHRHPLAGAAAAALRDFDGAMRAGDAAPLIFSAWARQLTRAVFVDELGGEAVYERVVGARTFRDALEGVLERDDAWWCDDKRMSAAVETCADRADAALAHALDELQQRFGADVSRWRWGDAHAARSEHRPFSRVPLLARLFELRVPTGGDTWTVNVGRVSVKPDAVTGELYLNEHAASLRAIYDVGDPTRSRVIHSSGQSGLPWSRHYRDFAGPWARGESVPLWGHANEATLQRMALRPGASLAPP